MRPLRGLGPRTQSLGRGGTSGPARPRLISKLVRLLREQQRNCQHSQRQQRPNAPKPRGEIFPFPRIVLETRRPRRISQTKETNRNGGPSVRPSARAACPLASLCGVYTASDKLASWFMKAVPTSEQAARPGSTSRAGSCAHLHGPASTRRATRPRANTRGIPKSTWKARKVPGVDSIDAEPSCLLPTPAGIGRGRIPRQDRQRRVAQRAGRVRSATTSPAANRTATGYASRHRLGELGTGCKLRKRDGRHTQPSPARKNRERFRGFYLGSALQNKKRRGLYYDSQRHDCKQLARMRLAR